MVEIESWLAQQLRATAAERVLICLLQCWKCHTGRKCCPNKEIMRKNFTTQLNQIFHDKLCKQSGNRRSE